MKQIIESQNILLDLGMPKAQQNEISALTLPALCNIDKKSRWIDASRQSMTISKDIMTFIKEKYGKKYAPNTRETFRRHVLHQFVQGRIADYNPDCPDLPTNSPRAHYAISDTALKAVRSFGLKEYRNQVDKFKRERGSLDETYKKIRDKNTIPLTLPGGDNVSLSPGRHNELQAAIIREFIPRFLKTTKILYIGDTAKKVIIMDLSSFASLKVNVSNHDKLPDVVLLDSSNNRLFLIEAVTSHGPMNPKRVFELQEMFKGCECDKVFVSAFPDFIEFKKHSKDISWETEVWISEVPEHMIHYNGDKFLGPTISKRKQ